MKRFITILIVILTFCLLLTSCGEDEIVPTVEPTATPKPSRDLYKSVKIGVLYCDDVNDRTGYSYSHDQGIDAMREELGLKESQIVKKFNVPTDEEKIIAAAEECIDAGCKLIFSTFEKFTDAIIKCVDKYPDIIFSQFTTDPKGAINSNRYYMREYQAKYLAGIIAASASKTGSLGYITSFAGATPLTCAGINAFALGAQSVNPKIKVFVRISKAFDDQEREDFHFKFLTDWDCDVFIQDTRTPHIQTLCEGKHIYCIGCRYDMRESAPEYNLTSTITDWKNYYVSAVKAFALGDWTSFGNVYSGLKDGTTGLADISDKCSEAARKKADSAASLMKSGRWDVFSGYKLEYDDYNNARVVAEAMKNNKKRVAIKAGADPLDDDYIQSEIDWFVLGVQFPENPSPSPTPEFTPTPEATATPKPTAKPTAAPTPAPES